MQPYFFPYLPYFQLIQAVDYFVFYDDVAYIKQGWINRNRIQVSGRLNYFTVPIENASSYKAINDTKIHKYEFEAWKAKFLKTLQQEYGRAPYFSDTSSLIKNIIATCPDSISELSICSVKKCCNYLGISTQFIRSSSEFPDKTIDGVERIIQICQLCKADEYINAIGGQSLYTDTAFKKHGINIKFLKTLSDESAPTCKHYNTELSILDLLMHCSPDKLKSMLMRFSLI